MTGDRAGGLILALLATVTGVGLLFLTAADGIVTGERGPRLGAFVDGNLVTALVLVVAGVLAATAALRSLDRMMIAAGLLLLVGAATHLAGIAVGIDLLGGSGSTVAAFLGLGAGMTVLGSTPDPDHA